MIASPRPALRSARQHDHQSIDTLYREAYGDHSKAETVRRLREDGDIKLEIVAHYADELVGAVSFARGEIHTPNEATQVAIFAALGVAPAYRGRRIGVALAQVGLGQMRHRDVKLAIARGHDRFFSRFGLTARAMERVASPWAHGGLIARAFSDDIDRIQGDAFFPRAFFEEVPNQM
jgi:predicted N-acetyltransferase YhbS